MDALQHLMLQVFISKDEQTILTGTRQPNGLWYMDQTPTILANMNQVQSNAAYCCLNENTADHLAFLHAALFSPVTSTLHAIQAGHLTTWPGLTISNVKRFLPKSVATYKGHLDQSRKNQRSTKPMEEPEDLTVPPSPAITDGKQTHFVYAAVLDILIETGRIYTDQTGNFPNVSQRGNKYLMVLYDYDSNSILVGPLRNRTDAQMIAAYDRLVERLT
jgi:hypothetical protein